MDNPRIAWKRLAIEAPVIVVSILLAFAIDAWWDERGERAAERVLLERLQSDFIVISSALRLVEEEHREASDACVYFLNMAIEETVPPTTEVDRKVAVVFLASRTFNPGSGAVASFSSGDGARLVRNQLLADKLFAWPGIVEELQEEEANLQKGVAERWTPFLSSRVNVAPYTLTFGEVMHGLPGAALSATRNPLVVDREFQNHVLDRFKWQQIALRDIEPVRNAVDEILQILSAELSSQG